MADFPTLRPTSRSLTFGQYPIKTYRALSGKVLRRSFGNRPFGHTLDLTFENVVDETVNQVFDHYNAQQGGTLGFALPDSIFSGASASMISRLKTPTGIEWIYAEPPSVESVFDGRSSISVKLVGEIVP